MTVVDTHVHVFPSFAGIMDGAPVVSHEYGQVKTGNRILQFLPPSFEKTQSNVETLMAYMNWCGVDRAVLLPNVLYGYHNEYVEGAALRFPERLKAVALVDVLKGKRAAEELKEMVENRGFYGLKIEVNSAFQCAPCLQLDDEFLSPIWSCCNKLALPVMLHLARPNDLKSMEKTVQEYENIKYVLCHMGAEPVLGVDDTESSFTAFLQMVMAYSNIWVETSSVSLYFPNEDYPYPSTTALIERAYKELGPERLLWGSDYPGMLSFGTYEQLVDIVRKNCKSITEEHKEMILGKNAVRLFWSEEHN